MGYHMAVNLRNKIGNDKFMVFSDVNQQACERFLAETADAGPSKIVKNAREAVEAAVSLHRSDEVRRISNSFSGNSVHGIALERRAESCLS